MEIAVVSEIQICTRLMVLGRSFIHQSAKRVEHIRTLSMKIHRVKSFQQSGIMDDSIDKTQLVR